MRALVTGGGGFLGLAVVRRLRARGDEVRSFSRGRYPVLEALGVEQHQGDLADAAAVGRAVAGCDVVVHAAAKAGVWGPSGDYHRVNVEGTRNVLAACKRYGVRRLVYTSTPSVVFTGRDLEGVDESVPYAGHFHAAYPKTKRIAEEEVLAHNGPDMATAALRPHLIWGPGDPHLIPRLLARARAGKLRIVGAGGNRVDPVYVDNAADAHVLAADRLAPGAPAAGRAFFISNGEPAVLWEFINRILAAAGLPPVKRRVPAGLAYAAGWFFETAHRALRLSGEPRITRFVARELATSHWFDLAAARRDLGYEPRVSTDEGLARLAEWFRDTGTTGGG
jgi:2-alkyl-3-oxoalkanoate reductase